MPRAHQGLCNGEFHRIHFLINSVISFVSDGAAPRVDTFPVARAPAARARLHVRVVHTATQQHAPSICMPAVTPTESY